MGATYHLGTIHHIIRVYVPIFSRFAIARKTLRLDSYIHARIPLSMYRTQEYRDMLAAQQLLSDDMHQADPEVRPNIIATLVKVVAMKRVLRGAGNPKPVDYSKRRRRTSANSTPAVPTDVVQPGSADPGATTTPADSSAQDAPNDS